MGTNTRVAIVAGEDAGPSFGSTPVPGPRTLIASRTEPGVPGAPTRTETTSSQGATAAGPSRTNCRAADGPAAGFRAISCASGHWAPSAGRPPSRFEGAGAVPRTLPALDTELRAPSLAASWAAAAALTAVYAPAVPAARTGLPGQPAGPHAAEDAFARAVEHGDEHVIKFADTAAEVYARTANADALAAAVRAADLIER